MYLQLPVERQVAASAGRFSFFHGMLIAFDIRQP
jgi:hypothetical protein